MLERVTFTGADNRTDPLELLYWSIRYPFIEWGILIGSRASAPRMPSAEWIERLLHCKANTSHQMNLSLHVCGAPLKAIAAGRPIAATGAELFRGFDRVQLNWHGERQQTIGLNIARAFVAMRDELQWDPEIIFQGDEVNAEAGLHVMTEKHGFKVSMLFDCSHGAGISPVAWPYQRADIKCGWAGGMGPDNFATEIERIDKAFKFYASNFPGYWVDMETKVRSGERGNDQFDLSKCREVAELAKSRIL